MSHAPMPTSLAPRASGPGKAMFFGMSAVAFGLSAFYMNLQRREDSRQSQGLNHAYEQRLGEAQTADNDSADYLHASRVENRLKPFPATVKDHHKRHATITTFQAKPSEISRFDEPSPQRSKSDDSERVYTKSPDFVRNYEKTHHYRPKAAQAEVPGVEAKI